MFIVRVYLNDVAVDGDPTVLPVINSGDSAPWLGCSTRRREGMDERNDTQHDNDIMAKKCKSRRGVVPRVIATVEVPLGRAYPPQVTESFFSKFFF